MTEFDFIRKSAPCLVIVRPLPRPRGADAALTAKQRRHALTSGDVTHGIDIRAARKPHKQRRPSIATLIKRAEKAGRPVTSVTTSDGTTLTFGEPQATEANNPWLAEIGKASKQ